MWPGEQSVSLAPPEAAPAHGFGMTRGADGRDSILCQKSLHAVWPSSNPPSADKEERADKGEGATRRGRL